MAIINNINISSFVSTRSLKWKFCHRARDVIFVNEGQIVINERAVRTRSR